MKRPRTLAEQRKNVRKLVGRASRQLTEERVREIVREEVSGALRRTSFQASSSRFRDR